MKPEDVRSRKDLVDFIIELNSSLSSEEAERPLRGYLDGIARIAHDLHGAYANRGEPFSDEPTWRMFAEILDAGIDYD